MKKKPRNIRTCCKHRLENVDKKLEDFMARNWAVITSSNSNSSSLAKERWLLQVTIQSYNYLFVVLLKTRSLVKSGHCFKY